MEPRDMTIIIVAFAIIVILALAVVHMLSTADEKAICQKDCTSFGMSFFRYEVGGFLGTETECWCRNGNESKQIW